PELVRDLASLIQRVEADSKVDVLVFKSADRDYFISHVDVTRIKQYRAEGLWDGCWASCDHLERPAYHDPPAFTTTVAPRTTDSARGAWSGDPRWSMSSVR